MTGVTSELGGNFEKSAVSKSLQGHHDNLNEFIDHASNSILLAWESRYLFFFFESISVRLGYRTLCSTLSIVIRFQFLFPPCLMFALEKCVSIPY